MVTASTAVQANQDMTYEPGFVEWSIIPHERLYVEGADVEEAVLQRGQTDSAIGGMTVGVTNGPVPVFTLQSPPVEQPIEAQVFMSVYFSAIIEGGGGPQSCTRQTWADSSTTLYYSVGVGSKELYSAEVTQTLDTSAEADAMNFSGELQNVTLSMQPGESITLSLSIEHRCIGTQARVQWGGFEQTAAASLLKGCSMSPRRVFWSMLPDWPTLNSNIAFRGGLKIYGTRNGRFGGPCCPPTNPFATVSTSSKQALAEFG